MQKKVLIFTFLIIGLLGCKGKEAELIIEEDITELTNSEEIQQPAKSGVNKPILSVSPSDIVQIFVREDGAPGMYVGEDGEVQGFYVDLEKEVMKEMHQSFRFVTYNDAGPVILGLKSGTHHFALAAPDIPDFRASFNLSIPYEILHFVTFVQNSNTTITGTTREEIIQSLHGKRVGVQTQGHIYQILRAIKEIELIEYPTTTKAMEDLNNGLLDAVPDVKRIGIYYATLYNWDIKPIGEPIISHKITTAMSQMFEPELLDRYNKALQTIIDDGRRDEIYESYFGPMEEEDKP